MSNQSVDPPIVMQDFVFGALESDANTLAADTLPLPARSVAFLIPA